MRPWQALTRCTVLATLGAALSPAISRAQPAPELLEAFEAKTFTGDSDGTLLYRIMPPAKDAAASPDGKFPLLLFLHGYGERGTDNTRQLYHLDPLGDAKWRERYPAYVVVPQCPTGKNAEGQEITWTARLAPGQPPKLQSEPTPPMALVMQLVDTLLEELPVDRTRVYVSGLSMGGYGTWDLAARRPEQFAAIAPICGGGDAASVTRFVDMPTWVFHGDADGTVPPARSREMVAALRAAGGRPILTEYAGVGHDSWRPALREQLLWDWMFAQHRDASGE
ncbi:MAG: dienelactone hydrolase family protein [Planctomycetales bacterium]|nr:dienelactone hydrolase family protein [Planctomycetales bacterium]